MKINMNWILFSLFNFFVAALMGLVLRGAFIWEFSWLDYRNLLHGHSHVAMLGWVYLALYALICYRFIPIEKRRMPTYARLFWFTQLTVVGMMVSFPIQGYGAVSIFFSALHILASYRFLYLVWKHHVARHPSSSLMLKTALVFMAVSTIGVWSLGPLAVTGGRNSILYQLAIQFYLHFQFHGWFGFAVLALLLDMLARDFRINTTLFKTFYPLLSASVLLTYGLVLKWGIGGSVPLVMNGLGLLLQLAAMLLFLKFINEAGRSFLQTSSPSVSLFYRFGLVSWIAKVSIQAVVLIPAAAAVSLVLRPLMIGFIHLILLGFVSGLLLALIFSLIKDASANIWLHWGSRAFVLGFLLTEILLFAQGLFYWLQWGQVPFYYELIFAVSVLLPLAVALISISVIKSSNGKLLRHATSIQ
ncbi:MAG TPA: hypothetical protein VK014_00315 [Cyclobacteriaceae bacterium]|nr:hypothetical protein [Cyclobacteriaceae bacterium]